MTPIVKFKIFLPIVLLIIIEVLIITKITSSLYESNLREDTVLNATQTIQQYQKIRQYYTKNVIEKVKGGSSISVNTVHKNIPDAIPLPATMIHELSEHINEEIDGMELKLYSDYPYNVREKRTLDKFEEEAIKYFRENGTREPLIKQERRDGIEVVRVAVADVMSNNACLGCHNSRADSPKRNWKIGDVRGVLEVIIPVKDQIERNNILARYINITLIVSGILLVIVIFIVVSYFGNVEKRQQEELKEKQYKLNKSLISFGKNVIASNTDTKGNITYASKAFCDISGYKEEELIGKPHNIVRHPDMPKEIFEDMWKSIKQGRIWEGEIKNKNKSGEIYWVRTTILPEYNYTNKLVGYSSIRHDITAQKAKEEFLSNMSHELRTPLNAIIGFLGILKRQTGNLKHLEYLNHIGSSSQQLLTLINDILDLSKIKTSEFTIDPYEFNAYDELKEQSYQLSGMLSSKDIAFVLNIHPILSGVFIGDWTRINQIILNLFSNAIKFTPEGGTITIDTDYSGNDFIVIVEDTGIGMSPDVQDKIFKPFVQADGSTTRKYGGTGLGLSITQKLIELMNGKLTLESEEGEGTIFRVSIPMEKLSSKIDKEDSVDIDYISNSTLSGKVLVAEDNKTNQILIELLLGEMGVECDIVDDGTEALESYDPDVHELILMDENMPNMNGITAMKHIREKYQERCGPIIALTANVMKGDRERFLSEGMDEYLSKPIDEVELYGILKKYLKDKQQTIV